MAQESERQIMPRKHIMNIYAETDKNEFMYSIHCNFAQYIDLGIINEGHHIEYTV